MLPVVVCSLSLPSQAAHPFGKANVSLWVVLRNGSGRGPSCVRRSPFLPPKPAEDHRLCRPWPLDHGPSVFPRPSHSCRMFLLTDDLQDRECCKRRKSSEQAVSHRKSSALHGAFWRESMSISSAWPQHTEVWQAGSDGARLRWTSPGFRVSSAGKVSASSWEKKGYSIHTFARDLGTALNLAFWNTFSPTDIHSIL